MPGVTLSFNLNPKWVKGNGTGEHECSECHDIIYGVQYRWTITVNGDIVKELFLCQSCYDEMEQEIKGLEGSAK